MDQLERQTDCEHHQGGRCADPWAACGRCCWDCEQLAACENACEAASASAWRELRQAMNG